jgi:hypothetical protein
MPRFYLHLCNGQGFIEDEEGSLHPDLPAAQQAAIDGLRDALAGDICNGEINLTAFIDIEDERHQHLFTIHFGDAVKVKTVNCREPR